MLNPVEMFLARIDSFVRPTDDTIRLASGDARQLDAVGNGNYIHIVLRAPGRSEVVKYTHSQDYDDKDVPDEISVQRDSCCRTSFAPCDSAEFIWVAEDILTLVAQRQEA
jgi:hypothetical protein